jgi:N-acetylneuraminic acid mutarotase
MVLVRQFMWIHLFMIILNIFCSKLVQSQDNTLLQWEFRFTPVRACETGLSTCNQASLSKGSVLLFDGGIGLTWKFQLTPFNASWSLVKTSNTPPADGRDCFAMSSVEDGKVLLFGGKNGGKIYADCWIFEQSVNDWVHVNIKTKAPNFPKARYNHAMASLGEGKVFLFGGTSEDETDLNDCWLFDVKTNLWEHVQSQTLPAARKGHAMSFLGQGSVLLFGGAFEDQIFDDTWIFNLNQKSWKQIKSSKVPEKRALHSMAQLKEAKALLFGGSTGSLSIEECGWIFDQNKNEWNKLSLIGECGIDSLPSARYLQRMASVGDGKLLMTGGRGSEHLLLPQTWLFALNDHSNDSCSWKRLDGGLPSTKTPDERSHHAVASIGVGKFLLFGGTNDKQSLMQDTWIYDQIKKNWERVDSEATISPSGRSEHAMVNIFNGGNKALLFGGTTTHYHNRRRQIYLNDTWMFDASTKDWTHLLSSPLPPARCLHGMASYRNTVVLFGGFADGEYLDDTWIYDLAQQSWENVKTTAPSRRKSFAMAHLGSGTSVLFGGRVSLNFQDIFYNDTWIFDHSKKEWTQLPLLPLEPHPGARSDHSIASLGENKLILFGGLNADYKLMGDSWLLHTSSKTKTTWKWTKLRATIRPRFGQKMARFNNSVIFFGGIANNIQGPSAVSAFNKEVWLLNNGCPLGFGGVGCTSCPIGTYSDNMNVVCSQCPTGTTTITTTTIQEQSCSVCITDKTSHGHCIVDLHNRTYKPIWKCNDQYYGPTCSIKCDCQNKQPCNDGQFGDGTCRCAFSHLLSGPKCSFPTMFFLIASLLAILLIGLFYYCRSYKKEQAKVQILDLDYELLEDDYNDLEIYAKENVQTLKQAYEVQLADIQLETVIGTGSFGEVWKGKWRGITVALKKMYSDAKDMCCEEMFDNLEVDVMMRLRHPRIVALLGVGSFSDPPLSGENEPRKGIFCLLEYAPGGDLEDKVKESEKILFYQTNETKASHMPFSKIQALEWAVQVAEGMKFLHSKHLVHRDLKPQNILLDVSDNALIADLGFVRSPITDEELDRSCSNRGSHRDSVDSKRSTSVTRSRSMTTMLGTPMYMAPEQVVDDLYSYPVDVWSFGVTLIRLFTLRSPFDENLHEDQIMSDVASGTLRPVPVQLKDVPHEDVMKIIKECIQMKPKNRPTFNEIEKRLRVTLKFVQREKREWK